MEKPTAVLPAQVRHLFDSDARDSTGAASNCIGIGKHAVELDFYVKEQRLLTWCRYAIAPYRLRIENLSAIFESGYILCAILARFRPGIFKLASLNPQESAKNLQSALEFAKTEFGIEAPGLLDSLLVGNLSHDLLYDYMKNLQGKLKSICPSTNVAEQGINQIISPGINPQFNKNYQRVPVKRKFCGGESGTGISDSGIQSGISNSGIDWEKENFAKENAEARKQKLSEMGENLFYKRLNGPNSFVQKNSPAQIEKISSERLKEMETMLKGDLDVRVKELKQKKAILKPFKLSPKKIENLEKKLEETALGLISNREKVRKFIHIPYFFAQDFVHYFHFVIESHLIN